MKRFLILFRFFFVSLVIALLGATSVWHPADQADRIRAYTRDYEFDYFGWTLDALWSKLSLVSIGPIHHMSASGQRQVLREYFQLLSETEKMEAALEAAYAAPQADRPAEDIAALEKALERHQAELGRLTLLAEAVIQDQVGQALDDLGLSAWRLPFPPVLYHVTDLPKNLVVSPRDVIRQEKNVSLLSSISLNDQIQIEGAVEENTDFSALVVPVGGVSAYPTMVIRTGNLRSLLETVAHEWTHNYLFMRPLGLSYSSSPALRTMNETTASIAEEEISRAVIRLFYWDMLPDESEQPYQTFETGFSLHQSQEEPPFDFRQEMYETRLLVDFLLEQGDIEGAEEFMALRRLVFLENGYPIRKLNQAYFAFHGAYADHPFSAAGADPVGADVRLLRARSSSLQAFLQTIGRMDSYEDLRGLLHSY